MKPLTRKKPETMSDEDWEEIDVIAFGVVRPTLTKSIALACAKETMTTRLIANQIYLIRQFFNLTLKEGGSVTDHIKQFVVQLVFAKSY